jgi:hypothetical protein
MSLVVQNTRAQTVATVTDMTLDTSTPINIIGRGYTGFGQTVFGNLYKIMENFASDTPPAAPAEGMTWYAPTAQELSFYNGSSWIVLAHSGNMMGAMLSRMGPADSVNFETAGTLNIHTAAVGTSSLVTSVLVVPQVGASVTGANIPSFTLEVSTSTGDICDKVAMLGLDAATKFFYHPIGGTNRIVAAGEVVKLVKDTLVVPADTLIADVYLFGHILYS